jgi:hypothetical protein
MSVNETTFFTGHVNSDLGYANLNDSAVSDLALQLDVNQITMNIMRHSNDTITKENPFDKKIRNIYLLKDSFASFMMRSNIKIFDFLSKPVSQKEDLQKTLNIIFKFQGKEFIPNQTVEELFIDTSMEEANEWVNSKIKADGTTIIEKFRSEINSFIELWIEVIRDLFKAEDVMSEKVKRIESIQQKIGTIQLLPVNEHLEAVLLDLEKYIEKEYTDINFEESYNTCIRIYKRLHVLQDIRNGIKALMDNDTTSMCPVCLEKAVDTAIIPCGHTFCSACIGRDMRYACPVCRSHISKKQKIFFS